MLINALIAHTHTRCMRPNLHMYTKITVALIVVHLSWSNGSSYGNLRAPSCAAPPLLAWRRRSLFFLPMKGQHRLCWFDKLLHYCWSNFPATTTNMTPGKIAKIVSERCLSRCQKSVALVSWLGFSDVSCFTEKRVNTSCYRLDRWMI